MTSVPLWELRISKVAEKSVRRAPRPDRERLLHALDDMRQNPFTGDVARLKGEPSTFRRRVGDWRVLFDVYVSHRIVEVVAIVRRTTTTHRHR